MCTEANFDTIKIRDGDEEDSPELSSLSGCDAVAPLETTGPSIFIHFFSDVSTTSEGFSAVATCVCKY